MPPKPKPLPVNWERIKRYREETGVNLFPKPRFPQAYYSRDTPPQSPRQSPPRSPPPPPQKKKRSPPPPPPPAPPATGQVMKKGGMVKKTGLALVHKGELVIPAHRVASVDKAVKKAGLKPLKK